MARRCSVCAHPTVVEINRAIVSGTPIRDVAGRFGLSRSAIARHSTDHIQHVMAMAVEAQVVTDIKLGADLLQHFRDLQQAGLDVLNSARRRGDDMMALAAIKTLTPIAERLAELPGPKPLNMPGDNRLTPAERIARHDRVRMMMAELEIRAQKRGGSFVDAPPEMVREAMAKMRASLPSPTYYRDGKKFDG